MPPLTHNNSWLNDADMCSRILDARGRLCVGFSLATIKLTQIKQIKQTSVTSSSRSRTMS